MSSAKLHTPPKTLISKVTGIEVLTNFENISPLVESFFDQSVRKAHMQSEEIPCLGDRLT
jgi:hypothetical protein